MLNFLKKLFSGGGKNHPPVEHNNFLITPHPRKIPGGWSTEATITSADNPEKQHTFIRADTSPTLEGAVALTVSKAKNLIEQQGEGIFK